MSQAMDQNPGEITHTKRKRHLLISDNIINKGKINGQGSLVLPVNPYNITC